MTITRRSLKPRPKLPRKLNSSAPLRRKRSGGNGQKRQLKLNDLDAWATGEIVGVETIAAGEGGIRVQAGAELEVGVGADREGMTRHGIGGTDKAERQGKRGGR